MRTTVNKYTHHLSNYFLKGIWRFNLNPGSEALAFQDSGDGIRVPRSVIKLFNVAAFEMERRQFMEEVGREGKALYVNLLAIGK